MGNATTYWGVLCRTCEKLIAFDARPFNKSGLGSAHKTPGAICCPLGHNHIYFPRDFRFFPSDTPITDATMQENRAAYEGVNPSSKLASDLDPAIWSGVRSVQEN